MKLQERRLLAVFDDENRALVGTIFEGERVRVIDARGHDRTGTLKRVTPGAVAVVFDGDFLKWLKFSQIDHLEVVK